MRPSTILEIPRQEQDWMLAELRHARRGCVLTLHVLLLCAAGRTPTEIAAVLFCSRTSVYRIVHAYHPQWREVCCEQPLPTRGGLTPSVRRSLLALLTKAPAVYGWCRTRWSCAALAAQLQLQRGVTNLVAVILAGSGCAQGQYNGPQEYEPCIFHHPSSAD